METVKLKMLLPLSPSKVRAPKEVETTARVEEAAETTISNQDSSSRRRTMSKTSRSMVVVLRALAKGTETRTTEEVVEAVAVAEVALKPWQRLQALKREMM